MPNENINNKKFNLKRYETDVAGVSINKLEAGLWWIKNRNFLKKLLVVFLLAAIIAGWAYSLYNFGVYLVKGMNQDEKMLRELVSTKTGGLDLLNARAAKDIIISSVGAVHNSSDPDFYAVIVNPNERHYGYFSYCFKRGEERLSCGEDFILPSGKKHVLSLNTADAYSSLALKFVIEEISWKRINAREIQDWEKYNQQRSDIKIRGIMATTDDSGQNLSFFAENNTVYGFWEVPLIIAAEKYGKTAAVNRYVMSQLASFEERQIKIKWPDESDLSGEISIYPDLDVLNRDIYMAPER